MDHQWFWQTEGEQYGPLSTDELEDLVRRNRVQDADQIRVDGSGEWLRAAQVKAMFGTAVDSESRETGAQSAARVLAGIDRMQLGREADEISWGTRCAGLVGKGARGPAGVWAICLDWVAAVLAQLLKFVGQKVTLVVVVLLLLAILFKNVEFGDSQIREVHAELAATFEQMQAMKKRGASKVEWQEFERETREWLKPMLKELGESSVRNQGGYDFLPISQFDTANAQRNLVGAGWALAEAISDAREPKPEVKPPAIERTKGKGEPILPLPPGQTLDPPELTFSKRMDMAMGFLNGEIKEIKTAAAAKTRTDSVDPLMAGMIVIDAGVVGGVFVYWWKRRRKT